MLPEYDGAINSLKETFEAFNEVATAGREGRGCKTNALKARKLSMKITEDLKDFRKLSITNDRSQ